MRDVLPDEQYEDEQRGPFDPIVPDRLDMCGT